MRIARPHRLLLAAALLFTIALPSCTREAKKERSLDAALKYFDKGDLAAAEIEYKNALAAEPGNSEAIKRLGIIRTRQGAHFEAAGLLTLGKRKLPTDNEVGIHLAKSLMGVGFVPDSRKELLEILDRAPDNGEALLQLAEISITPEWMDECGERIKAAGDKSVVARLVTAMFDLRRGQIESGTAIVEEVLKSDPGSARAHSLKASILNYKKLPDQALAELKIALDLAGARSSESIAYCHALVVNKRRDEAVAILEKITSDTPDYLPAWALLGEIAYREKQDEKATEYFSKVLSRNPIDLNVVLMQAEILARGKQPEKAVELLEKVESALPGRPQILLSLAKSLIAADKSPRAAGVLDRLLAAFPKLTEATTLRARIQIQEGKSNEAIAALEEIHGREPNDAASRDLLVHAYRSVGRNDDAIALLRKKFAAGNEDPRSLIEFGQLLSAKGKLDDARSAFETAAETSADGFEAVSNLAVLDMKIGRSDEALKRVEKFLSAHPESSEAYVFKAGIELELMRPGPAEQSLAKALDLKPDNAKAFSLLLPLKSAPGLETEALAILDRYLKAFPKDSQARLQKGTLQQQLGRTEDARATFSELITINPEFTPAYNNLAALESGNPKTLESAATHARKARAIDPAHPAIADTLGWIEWQLGNYPAALALLTEAAGKMADSPEVLYHLGMAHYSMGQSAEAAAAFTKALALPTDFPAKEDARKHLALLSDSGKGTPTNLDDLQKRVAANPKDIVSLLQLAELLVRGDRPQDALDAYQKALGVNPATPAALVGQARLYAGPLKSPEKALAAATKARGLAPRDPAVVATLGHVKLLTGANEEAYGLLKDASVQLENNPTVAFDYARAAYSLGRMAEARAAMTRVAAAADTPAASDAKRFLTLTDADAAKQPGIAAEVEQALTLDPENVPALMLRGSLETASGKSPEATYLKILALQPRFDPARVRLAAVYMEDPAKLDQALSLASEARSRMTGDEELTRIVAVINYRKGDFKSASRLLAELSTKRPLVPGELLVFGLSLANSDQPEKSRQTLDQALAAGLSDPEAAQAKAVLEKLAKPAGSE